MSHRMKTYAGPSDSWRWDWLESVVQRPPNGLAYGNGEDTDAVAVLIEGDSVGCHPLIDPAAWSDDSAVEMLAHAENRSTPDTHNGHEAVHTWADDKDLKLQQLLQMRGYRRHGSAHALVAHGGPSLTQPGILVLDGTAVPPQRKERGKAVMTEALSRLARLGAQKACISWCKAPAGALDQSVEFTVRETSRVWIKAW